MTSPSDPIDEETPRQTVPCQSGWAATDLDWARRRVERKHKLRADVIAYVVVNLSLVGAWAVTGFGYFWPGWVIAAWAVLLLLDAIPIYFHRPVTAAEIDRELRTRG
ncbi:2TM domain-containing protein [Nocardia seriolae]|uniref:2TM domain-containing protein n=1 Tax=Nocardia seriolae TaxID=37332 RepID=A0ABC8B3I1_9NOCA|nr:2TM domain-containing protein [Nocardia seriolae]APB01061.1 hypothetical protein NS506_07034 [Nocardia seriolae]QOW33054.1 2TM domain-containing protein [Nocardia seriolae]QUN14707.1 2TM domain-containing protein [Nocardia seriolae]WKY53980.1 2TM domain-containing protein [Nocardia seriolae]WNJ60756.1 2TM domain-containing protein [Nocardia seriolae]